MPNDDRAPGAPLGPLLARAVHYGFATSLAGWVLAYALRLPGNYVPPALIGVGLIGAQLVGAARAGSRAGPTAPWLAGLATALLASALNLLIILSAFTGGSDDQSRALDPALAALTYLPISAFVGAIAGWIGGRARRAEPTIEPNWIGRFAILNTLAAFILLIVGGIVTSAAAGLAVPDWPSSFGDNMFLFPLSKMTGGVFIEHAHRLLAVLVALTTATLLGWSIAARTPIRTILAVGLASALVITQAILGGVRVIEAATTIAIVHGVIGQLYVASLAFAAALLSTTWRSPREPTPIAGAGALRTLILVALIALIVQIGFGAVVRHSHLQPHILWTHVSWSVVVTILLLAAGVRGQHRLGPVSPILRRAATATKHTVLLQMALGVVALIAAILYKDANPPPPVSIALRTTHQAVGNVLLIAATLLTAWTIRLTRPAPHRHDGPTDP